MLRETLCVFDIETVPDVETGRRLYGLGDLDDAGVAEAMFQRRRQEAGVDFLRPHLHRVAAISVLMRDEGRCRIWSLGEAGSPEAELIGRFFDGIERYTPTLVSWNGGGFDLPVLHYRALRHAIGAPRYWEVGDRDRDFRWNSYIGRFHWRHIDLMDVIAAYQPRAVAPLGEVATLLGLPGKLGMDGSRVWASVQAGELGAVRDYCETDVLNTYLIYLRFELMRGHLDAPGFEAECRLLASTLAGSERPHLEAFLAAWQRGSGAPGASA